MYKVTLISVSIVDWLQDITCEFSIYTFRKLKNIYRKTDLLQQMCFNVVTIDKYR